MDLGGNDIVFCTGETVLVDATNKKGKNTNPKVKKWKELKDQRSEKVCTYLEELYYNFALEEQVQN